MINYQGLWDLLELRQMSKDEFRKRVSLSTNTLSKLSNNDPVSSSTLDRISKYFNCPISCLLNSDENNQNLKKYTTTLLDYLLDYIKYANERLSYYKEHINLEKCIKKIALPSTLEETCNYKKTDCENLSGLQKFISSFDERSVERKKMGVYYTPNDVISFIIKNTLKEFTKNNTSIKTENITALDPTCGCGDFLLNLYYLKSEYQPNDDKTIINIVKTIHGNDISPLYVDLSKLRIFFDIIEKYNINNVDSLIDILNSNFTVCDYISEPLTAGNEYDIIIGNPPYVESRDYPIPSTIKFKNTYGDIIANSLNACHKKGTIGFIIPLSYISTPRMHTLRDIIKNACSYECIYNFNDRPDCLFTKVHQKLSILIASKGEGKHNLYTSGYTYWYKEERYALFNELSIIKNEWVENKNYYPKLGNNIDCSIYKKIKTIGTKTIHDLIMQPGNSNISLNMRATFWIKAFSKNPGSKEYKDYSIQNKYHSFLICLFNSSLFWWYWTVVSDCWHITEKELCNFYIPDKITLDFTQLAANLEEKLNSTKKYVHTKQTEYEYKHKLCKSEIDYIDIKLSMLYDLSDKELKYIINYQDKYRRAL